MFDSTSTSEASVHMGAWHAGCGHYQDLVFSLSSIL